MAHSEFLLIVSFNQLATCVGTYLFLCSLCHQAGIEQPWEVCGSWGGRLQRSGFGNGVHRGGRGPFRWTPAGSWRDPDQHQQDDCSGGSVLVGGSFEPKGDCYVSEICKRFTTVLNLYLKDTSCFQRHRLLIHLAHFIAVPNCIA